MGPRSTPPSWGMCVLHSVKFTKEKKKAKKKSRILLKVNNFLRILLISYIEMGLLPPNMESRTMDLLLNIEFKNRTCHLESFLRFSRMVVSKGSPPFDSPMRL